MEHNTLHRLPVQWWFYSYTPACTCRGRRQRGGFTARTLHQVAHDALQLVEIRREEEIVGSRRDLPELVLVHLRIVTD